MTRVRMSRRHLGRLLAAVLAAAPRALRAQGLDQGIGGTGVVGDPKEEPSDQGIGGTGVVGTIRRFGSIYVNGLRITYRENLPVAIDGLRSRAGDLKLGHVVRVATMDSRGTLRARSITVVHEVVGPIDAVGAHGITVLGQAVSLENAASPPLPLAVGQTVAVSGLRRLDGTIMASLVEAAASTRVHVAGPLVRSADGVPMIGALPIARVDPSLVGQRVSLTGHRQGTALVVDAAVAETTALARLGTARWSLEGYVTHDASGLRLGSGLQLQGDVTPAVSDELALVTVDRGPRGRLTAEKIQLEASLQPDGERARVNKDDARHGLGRSSEGGRDGSRGRR